MIRLRYSVSLAYNVLSQPADFVFNIQAATTACQRVISESLHINQAVAQHFHFDALHRNRLLRLRAETGRLTVNYQAEVEIGHHWDSPAHLIEMPIHALPTDVLPYLYPSRYCESDKIQALANREFGHIPPGYGRVDSIRSWVNQHLRFTSGSSNFSTSAMDTLSQRVGVCRDFAHLMIAICRALNIPARFSSGLDYGADPALGPTDFHAYVEVYLGHRWYLFDPSGTAVPMGFVRIGTGRDAADIAFATIFGSINASVPVLTIEAVVDPLRGLELPIHVSDALSTDH
ncbi:MAG: hypothetical protein RIR00_1055 [Pseudomonadota bacterium]